MLGHGDYEPLLDLFGSSEWRQLSQDKLLEIDAWSSQQIPTLFGLAEKVRYVSGWHFEQLCKASELFPQISKCIQQFAIETIEDLKKYFQLEIPRLAQKKGIKMEISDELNKLVGHPIFFPVVTSFYEPLRLQEAKSEIVDAQLDEILRKPLLELFEETLSKNNEKTKVVIRSRLGLGGPRRSLEEIGNVLGLTRERVRQIEQKFYMRSEKSERWDDVLREKLQLIYNHASSPVTPLDLEMKDPWFVGISSNPRVFEGLLEKYNNAVTGWGSGSQWCFYVIYDITPGGLISRMSKKDLNKSVVSTRKIVNANFGGYSKKGEVRDFIAALCPEEFRLNRDIFVELVSENYDSTVIGDVVRVAGQRDSVRTRMADLIHFSTASFITYESLKRKYIETFNEAPRQNQISNALAESDLELIGNGKYASAEAFDLIPSDIEKINQFCVDLIKMGGDRQWHCEEIFEKIKQNELKRKLKFGSYSVYYATKFDPKNIIRLGRLVIGDAAIYKSITDRFDVYDLTLQCLKNATNPLTTNQIRACIERRRGLGKHFQVWPRKGIKQVSSGKFVYEAE